MVTSRRLINGATKRKKDMGKGKEKIATRVVKGPHRKSRVPKL